MRGKWCSSTTYRARADRHAVLALLAPIAELAATVHAAGAERSVARHRQRGKLLARERVDLLLDEDAPFLEFGALAGAHDPEHEQPGARVITGIGPVSGVECVIIANEPTTEGGTLTPPGVRKQLRALDVAAANRLPVVSLVESGGADLPRQADIFVPGGGIFQRLTRLSGAGVPTVALVFGSSTAGGAYLPGMSEYTVLVRERASVYLGGPPLVKMALGEDADDETLGGAEMHARTSGLADHLAVDEHDAVRIGREIVADLHWRKLGPAPSLPADPPLLDADGLLACTASDPKRAVEVREVLARVLDGSRFDEFKPLYGTTLVCGWGSIAGRPVGVLANNQRRRQLRGPARHRDDRRVLRRRELRHVRARLRPAVRVRRLRRRRRGRRPDVRRPVPRGDPGDGPQGPGQGDRPQGRRAGAHPWLLDPPPATPAVVHLAAAVAVTATRRRAADAVTGFAPAGFRILPAAPPATTVWSPGPVTVGHRLGEDALTLLVDGVEHGFGLIDLGPDGVRLVHDGVAVPCTVAPAPDGTVWVGDPAAQSVWRPAPRLPEPELAAAATGPVAEVPGTVVAAHVAAGDHVVAGQPLVVLEATKMEHPALAAAAVVEAVHVEAGGTCREVECDRLVALGATRLRRDEPAPPLTGGHIVMADPEGNEFCLG